METPPQSPAESPTESPEPENENPPVLGYVPAGSLQGEVARHAPQHVVVWSRLLAIILFAVAVERIALILLVVLGLSFDTRSSRFPFAASSLAGSCVICGIWPLLAWYCWARAPQLAIRISRGTTPPGTSGATADPVRANEILCVALLVLGLYQVSEGLPRLTVLFDPSYPRIRNLSDLPWRELTMPLLRLGMGAALIFGNHKIAVHLRKLGRAPEQIPEQTSE